jgi:RNA polymerase sigma-70 factor (ECF subfamily)
MSDSRKGTSLTLLARLRASDEDAWARLVQLYGPLVAYWVGRGGVAAADVEDVTQEVFREVSQALPNFRREREGDTFRGWLRGVTRIAVLRYWRAAQRRQQAAGGTVARDMLEAVPAPAESGDEDDPVSEQHALYRRALELVKGEFEPRTWQMFWATTVDGRKPTEVAAELGVSSAAVRQAKSRVLRRVKEEVGEIVDDP